MALKCRSPLTKHYLVWVAHSANCLLTLCMAGNLSFTSDGRSIFREGSSLSKAVTSSLPSLIIHLTFLQEEPDGTIPFSQNSCRPPRMPHKDTLLLRISFSSAQSIPCSNDADMAGTIQASEGHHDVETNMFVPQSPQGEEGSGPGRNCSGFEDTQDLETAVCPPLLLPMAPCGFQVCLCSEGKGSCCPLRPVPDSE